MKAHTPDEKLMIQFYRAAGGKPDLEIEVKPASEKAGLKATAVKNIVKHLAQANFIKKIDQEHICLTAHGCSFVHDHLRDS